MAAYFNKVILLGRIVRDLEAKQLNTGATVCNFTLVTNKFKNGESIPQWHNIVLFGKSADFAVESLSGGDMAMVEGEINYDSWTGKDGTKKNGVKIICYKILPMEQKTNYAKKSTGQVDGSEGHSTEIVPEPDVPF